MHSLDTIHARNLAAVRREYLDALMDGAQGLAREIYDANPDLAAERRAVVRSLLGSVATIEHTDGATTPRIRPRCGKIGPWQVTPCHRAQDHPGVCDHG